MRHGLLAVTVLALAGCGGDGGGGGAGGGGSDEIQPVTVRLNEMNNSRKTGTAELQPGAASTDITIALEPPQGDNQPIHIHRGTCESPEAEVVHDLGFTTAGLGQGQAFVLQPELTTGEFIIDIHDHRSDEVIVCGAIPER